MLVKLRRVLRRKIDSIRSKYKSSVEICVNDNVLTFSTTNPVSKKWFFPRYINGEQHEPGVTSVFCQEISENDLVFDIGANQGYFSLLSAYLANTGEVHSFEIDPILVSNIRSSLALNPRINNVRIVGGAVHENSCNYFGFVPHIPGNLTTNEATPNIHSSDVIVPSISIDDYVEYSGSHPDFIKMDIEGAEFSALKGMKKTLQQYKPKLLVEIHPIQLAANNITALEILQWVIEVVPTYKLYALAGYRKVEKMMQDVSNLKEFESQNNPFVAYFQSYK